ncbi:MAG: TaqI-like C-terminal specificity domain-containing protein, partial [Saprospiraceae bacterium]
MYMCRETIRRAVVQKFNEAKGWPCETIDELYEKITDRKEANAIINSLHICDPAVGSGHFLVSALNEIIAIKSELKVLLDRDGRWLKEYHIEVSNDELIISDEDDFFVYRPGNKESQRVQETLFHEKQTIIENCLFGVDINPNSVKICRLRLWIELLKHAYYKNETELETLPNIDINIKCGNSLVSRYAIDADLRQALKKSKFTIDSYKIAVDTYRNAENREQKREMEKLITSIKSDFRSEISANDPKIKKLNKLSDDLYHTANPGGLFEQTKAEKAARDLKVQQLSKEIEKLQAEVEEIKANKIYENAFEWRFEFPEVLNDDGDFVGFDVVVANPPYGVRFNTDEKKYLKSNFNTIIGKYDSYGFFIEKGIILLKSKGMFSYIIPHTWLTVTEAQSLRKYLIEETHLLEVDILPSNVFEDATVETTNLFLKKSQDGNLLNKIIVKNISNKLNVNFEEPYLVFNQMDWAEKMIFNTKINSIETNIIERIKKFCVNLEDVFDTSVGVQAYDKYAGQNESIIINRKFHASHKVNETYRKELNGRDIARYEINWPGNAWISYGNWLAHPRKPIFFSGPRILIREITASEKYPIIATYTDIDFINYKSILNIISKEQNIIKFKSTEIQLKYLTGILNSSLIGWYFRLNSNKNVTKTFPRISLHDIKKFPIIIKGELNLVNLIAQKVEFVLVEKAKGESN